MRILLTFTSKYNNFNFNDNWGYHLSYLKRFWKNVVTKCSLLNEEASLHDIKWGYNLIDSILAPPPLIDNSWITTTTTIISITTTTITISTTRFLLIVFIVVQLLKMISIDYMEERWRHFSSCINEMFHHCFSLVGHSMLVM